MGGNTAFHFCCMGVSKSKSSNNDDDDGQVLHSSLSGDDNGVEYSVDDDGIDYDPSTCRVEAAINMLLKYTPVGQQ